MKYIYNEENNTLIVKLDEEIDMNSCRALRNIIDGYILKYSPKECIFDLKEVSFMDSSGLGLIIGRYNLIKMIGSKMCLQSPCQSIKKVLELSNLEDSIRIV